MYFKNRYSSSNKFDFMILFAPFGKHFTEAFFGKIFGKFLSSFLSNLLFVGTFYSSKNFANTYKISGDILQIKKNLKNKSKVEFKYFRKTFNKLIFNKYIMPVYKHTDSSHYQSNLLDLQKKLFERSEFKKNLFIVDGNLFPGKTEPAPNSLSIMGAAYTIGENFIKKIS
jgi:N-acetylneuraminic acid mutarotase